MLALLKAISKLNHLPIHYLPNSHPQPRTRNAVLTSRLRPLRLQHRSTTSPKHLLPPAHHRPIRHLPQTQPHLPHHPPPLRNLPLIPHHHRLHPRPHHLLPLHDQHPVHLRLNRPPQIRLPLTLQHNELRPQHPPPNAHDAHRPNLLPRPPLPQFRHDRRHLHLRRLRLFVGFPLRTLRPRGNIALHRALQMHSVVWCNHHVHHRNELCDFWDYG